jgi:hypothetical protein
MKNEKGLHAAMVAWGRLREQAPGLRDQPDSDVFGFLASLTGSLEPLPIASRLICVELAIAYLKPLRSECEEKT